MSGMLRSLLVACMGAALLGGAAAGWPSWYECDCEGKANCMCPSTSAPGGLEGRDVPQFILFTHDDAIMSSTDRYIRDVCDGRTNPNGCPARATMFTLRQNTDCDLAYQMWKDGYEIADHTVDHKAMDSSMSKEDVEKEILGMRSWVDVQCGIPAEEVRGFRNPYLTTTPATRQVLAENGFLYDSTLIEGPSASLSRGMDDRVWPYTLQDGIPQNCAYYAPSQKCDPEREKYKGLWEVPMWTMSATGHEYTMDYGDDHVDVYKILTENFKAAYFGNRAPLPLWIHTPWITKDRIKELQKFADFTLGLGDVYWVTISQLLEWMQNPVPASELKRSGAMCGMAPSPPPPSPPPPSPPPPQPLPEQGLYLNLTLLGANETALAERSEELAAAVAELLGTEPGHTFVQRVLPLADPPAPSPAASPAPAPAGGKGSDRVSAKSDGVEEAGQAGAADASDAVTLQVTLVASDADPLELYLAAAQNCTAEALASALEPLGLELAGDPVALPFKDGKPMPLPSPPSPPPTPSADGDGGRVHRESVDPATAASGTHHSKHSSGGSSSIPLGLLIGLSAVGGAAVAALGVVVAAIAIKRRRLAAEAAAALPASIAEDKKEDKEDGSHHHAIRVVASATSTPRLTPRHTPRAFGAEYH